MVAGFAAANARRGIPAWKARSASARVGNDLKRAPANLSTSARVVAHSEKMPVCLPAHTT